MNKGVVPEGRDIADRKKAEKQIKAAIKEKEVLLDVTTAIPCGLIINELVSNALN